jgi:glutamate-1-semialdehyde aminotransferase
MVTRGVIEFDTEILQQLFELKNLYNFNIIFDETVTGLGRADYSFDWKPDILITSKGLTNGLFPLSAVMVNENIGNYIKDTDRVFLHGYTMSGHPIACQTLLKTIDSSHIIVGRFPSTALNSILISLVKTEELNGITNLYLGSPIKLELEAESFIYNP